MFFLLLFTRSPSSLSSWWKDHGNEGRLYVNLRGPWHRGIPTSVHLWPKFSVQPMETSLKQEIFMWSHVVVIAHPLAVKNPVLSITIEQLGSSSMDLVFVLFIWHIFADNYRRMPLGITRSCLFNLLLTNNCLTYLTTIILAIVKLHARSAHTIYNTFWSNFISTQINV